MVRTVLDQARTKDALTLISFLARSKPHQPGTIFDRAAQLLPPLPGDQRRRGEGQIFF
jgi:hypothetical protein